MLRVPGDGYVRAHHLPKYEKLCGRNISIAYTVAMMKAPKETATKVPANMQTQTNRVRLCSHKMAAAQPTAHKPTMKLDPSSATQPTAVMGIKGKSATNHETGTPNAQPAIHWGVSNSRHSTVYPEAVMVRSNKQWKNAARHHWKHRILRRVPRGCSATTSSRMPFRENFNGLLGPPNHSVLKVRQNQFDQSRRRETKWLQQRRASGRKGAAQSKAGQQAVRSAGAPEGPAGLRLAAFARKAAIAGPSFSSNAGSSPSASITPRAIAYSTAACAGSAV